MRVKLTAKYVENASSGEKRRKEFWDASLPGFGLRVTEHGKKSWVLMYRVRNRQRRMTIGSYPAFSLAEAREEARAALRIIETGIDPAEEKIAAKRKPTTQFKEIIDDFIKIYAKPKNRSWKDAQRILKKYAEPKLGHYRLDEIERHHILDILDTLVSSGAATQANRVLAHVRKLFNWTLDRGMIDRSPVVGLKAPSKENARDRVLSDKELKTLWPIWEKLDWPFGPIFKLLLVTGQRRNEVTTMKWSNINLETKTWTIPRDVAKNDRTHEVPLSDLALGIIDTLPHIKNCDYIFSTTGRTPVSGFSKIKKGCDIDANIHDWRLHDLRRTCASGMARLGIAPHVVEKILNHSSGTISGVAAVYNRYGYEVEKRNALNRWADQLVDLLVSTEAPRGQCHEGNWQRPDL